ncbi:MAG: OsmC family protein [Blastocatellia bacterium]|nr:OsmC family protein [Blastocatellia bacterium]MCS7158428.1 OsmC family protein [Blastocatellia bacterium]MCX7752934.1 OsmC family protein [Blastocatellia bacterium]MDW8167990.1 OsmC family protein [Acidobacteriota bacterium]MDW8256365.1 OsmC family protein [Acidobacteriota bacterium]
MGVNNVNTEAVMAFAADVQRDPQAAKKRKRVEGEWVLEEGQPQFRARLEYPAGADVVEADGAPFMGGGGRKPDPIQYCLYGLASCFAGTFATLAAMEGITLKKLIVAAENRVDLSRTLGLSSNPIIEGVEITVTVSADAPREKLEEIERLARERCPGAYCITNPIPLTTSLVVE